MKVNPVYKQETRASARSFRLPLVILVFNSVLAAVALVLPGISVSYMLLMLGLYDMTVKAITQLDIGRLLPLALCVVFTLFWAQLAARIAAAADSLLLNRLTGAILTAVGLLLLVLNLL